MTATELQKFIDDNFNGVARQFAVDIRVSAQVVDNWLKRDKVPEWVGRIVELMENIADDNAQFHKIRELLDTCGK